MVSKDKVFNTIGAVSGIKYSEDFVARKQFLEKNVIDAPKESRALLDFWIREVYAGVPGLVAAPEPGEDETFNFSTNQEEHANRIFRGEISSAPSTPTPSAVIQNLSAFTRRTDTLPDLSTPTVQGFARPSLSRESTIVPHVPALSPFVLSAPNPVISESASEDSEAAGPSAIIITTGIEALALTDARAVADLEESASTSGRSGGHGRNQGGASTGS